MQKRCEQAQKDLYKGMKPSRAQARTKIHKMGGLHGEHLLVKVQNDSDEPIPVVLIWSDMSNVLTANLISVELGKSIEILSIASKEKWNQ